MDSAEAPSPTRRASFFNRTPLWMLLTAVATAMVAVAIDWFSESDVAQVERPLGIARVIRIDGTGSVAGGQNSDRGNNGNQRELVSGSELYAGEDLAMQRGLIELAFRDTGVHVIATAPLKLKLDSDQRVSLHEGQVKLVVPPQGVGFVVDTPQRKFVDLGTSFVVTANGEGSEVLVLDGQISVGDLDGSPGDLMGEGEFAKFDRVGKLKKRTPSRLALAIPELALPVSTTHENTLGGVILGYDEQVTLEKTRLDVDVIGRSLLPLIETGFQDRDCTKSFRQGKTLSFRGIAGAYHEFPHRSGLTPYSSDGGWMAWYQGKVVPPKSGRYRFWGYADNYLLVAINGKPVFEGSRHDAAFQELSVPRTNNPALPCLIARAGFACSDWVEMTGEPVQLDILFGEIGGNITSGLLLVEREGDHYEETLWGQPKWPLFLTEAPSTKETAEFKRLVNHLEQKTMGSFSVSENAVWHVTE